MSAPLPNVLSIAGSDPSGGAGIQADLKTFAALGVYGCAVPAVLTAQNTVGVTDVFAVPAAFLREQLDAVFSDVRIDAVKIGMLGSKEAVRTVSAVLRDYRPGIVVLDPVLRSSTGATLLELDAIAFLRDELLPLATLITPNAEEAGTLLDTPPPSTIADAAEAAARLASRTMHAVLVTGMTRESTGSGPAAVVDVLYDRGDIVEFELTRVDSPNTHGTGCTASSAAAALLALGNDMRSACRAAQRFVAASIAAGSRLRAGRGPGPVNQRLEADDVYAFKLDDLTAERN